MVQNCRNEWHQYVYAPYCYKCYTQVISSGKQGLLEIYDSDVCLQHNKVGMHAR